MMVRNVNIRIVVASVRMKLMVQHELPKRLRYAKVYMELASASVFFSLDGSKASVYGSIGTSTKPIALSDPDYARHRTSSKVVEVLNQDDDRVVVKTEDGMEEEWVRPKWVLVGVRRARADGRFAQ